MGVLGCLFNFSLSLYFSSYTRLGWDVFLILFSLCIFLTIRCDGLGCLFYFSLFFCHCHCNCFYFFISLSLSLCLSLSHSASVSLSPMYKRRSSCCSYFECNNSIILSLHFRAPRYIKFQTLIKCQYNVHIQYSHFNIHSNKWKCTSQILFRV